MRPKSILVGIALTGSLFFASSAQAAIVDFTAPGWLGGTSNTQVIGGGIGSVTVSVFSGAGNLNADSVGNLGQPPCGFLSCSADGIGIGDDEVNGQEVLRVNFDDGPVNVTSIGFLDLFNPEGGSPEFAEWSVNGGPATSQASLSNPNGWVDATGLALLGVNFIDFFTTITPQSDFALAYLDARTSAIPIPAAFSLLASAFGLLGFLGWRRRNT